MLLSDSQSNLFDGYCQCGCGTYTGFHAVNDSFLGYVKGEPKKWARGHNNKARSHFLRSRFIKTCVTCGETKPADAFRVSRNKCKNCVHETRRRDIEGNREYYNEQARQWRKANRESSTASVYRWREKNPEEAARILRNANARRKGAQGDGAKFSELVAEHGPICYLCEEAEATQVEHMTPLSRGGTNYRENLRLACEPCNYRKYNRTYEEYIAWLKETGKA
jgi:5-methylcytosine-specific restriction endonuclease McrA